MSFKNIILGTQRKSYTHDLSFDNNTTMDFGVLQPLLSQFMLPKSSIKVSSRQLVRLAPMPTPSFARMYLANYASFVKMTDVVPYYESLLSKIPFTGSSSTFQPVSMPYTTNQSLLYFLLRDSFVECYQETSTPGKYQIVTDDPSFGALKSEFVSLFFSTSISSSSPFYPKFKWLSDSTLPIFPRPHLSPINADFTFRFGVDTDHVGKYILCFKYSAAASRLRKVLIGLGYSPAFNDNIHVSIAPLLAYYKAYFDRFGLSRDLPFEVTSCYKIIKLIENYSINFALSNDVPGALLDFICDELSNCWYTSANSYIAAHRSSLTNSIAARNFTLDTAQQGSVRLSSQNSSVSFPHLSSSASNFTLTALSLDVLKRLSSFVNKDSAIGKRMSDWVRVHYGADVSNSLFEESSRINEWRTNIDIDDVFSTSDTADVGTPQKGEYLGSYAGKGSGFSSSGFSFKAPYHGFIFVMSCVVPLSNTFQGVDPTLLAVDLDTIPQPEFDALGFEATPRSVFVSDNGIGSSYHSNKFSETFGFVPRYTGFKVKKNIVNGDMCKGFYQSDLLPYFNDRMLFNNVSGVTDVSTDTSGKVTGFSYYLDTDKVPNASTEFQKICRYSFMGDYNRLFYNTDSVSYKPVDDVSLPPDDNFIVQTVFDVRVSNFLKPVQNSYDTIDEDVDNNTTSVETV